MQGLTPPFLRSGSPWGAGWTPKLPKSWRAAGWRDAGDGTKIFYHGRDVGGGILRSTSPGQEHSLATRLAQDQQGYPHASRRGPNKTRTPLAAHLPKPRWKGGIAMSHNLGFYSQLIQVSLSIEAQYRISMASGVLSEMIYLIAAW